MSRHSSTGLYDPSFEHDSCGFGLIANIDDIASHWVVETAIAALARLTHRGAKSFSAVLHIIDAEASSETISRDLSSSTGRFVALVRWAT